MHSNITRTQVIVLGSKGGLSGPMLDTATMTDPEAAGRLQADIEGTVAHLLALPGVDRVLVKSETEYRLGDAPRKCRTNHTHSRCTRCGQSDDMCAKQVKANGHRCCVHCANRDTHDAAKQAN